MYLLARLQNQFSDHTLRSEQQQYSGWCKYSNTFPCERSGATGFTKIGQNPDPCQVSCAFDTNPTQCRHGPSGSPAYMPEGTICAPATATGGFATCQNNVCTSAVDPKLNSGGGGGGTTPSPPDPASISISLPNAGSTWTAAEL